MTTTRTLLQIIRTDGSEQYVRYLDGVSAEASRARFAKSPGVRSAHLLAS